MLFSFICVTIQVFDMICNLRYTVFKQDLTHLSHRKITEVDSFKAWNNLP